MGLALSSTAFSSYPSHEIWGMNSLTAKNILSFTKLMFYDSDSIQADCEAPSPEEIKRCLRMIRYSKSEATISELETLVQSARTWQLFEFLIRREQVIPHLIQLLRSHTTINLILAYRYGLMCIQLLVCVMAAGVTDEYDKRDDVYEAIRIESDGETRIWSRVADYASLVMCGAVMSGSDHQDAQRLVKQRFAGCYWGTKYVIFPKLGGLFKEDALWMLDELWEGRKDFLWVCNSFVRGSPGWSVLFTAFYHNIMEAGRPITLLQKLRGLLLRYSIFVPYPEFDHICKMIGEIEDNNSIIYFMDNHPSVDEQEANLMVDMFQRIFESSRYSYGRSTPLVIRYPFGLVYHSALAIIPDRAPPLLALVIERSWEGLQDPCSILKFKERILDSFEYAHTVIVCMSTALMVGALQRQSKKVAIAVWTKLLRDINILELIGRLCSITVISTNGSADGLLLSELDDHIPLTREDTRELLPVDQQDANFMITLFSCIFNSEPPPRGQSELICYPFGLVYHNALVAQPESAPFLLVAAIERVWKKLGDPESGMTLRERILDSFEYAIRATMSMSIALTSGGERSKRITATVWTKLLHDVNILELTEEPNTYVCVAAGCITALDGVNHCTGIMILTRHIGMNASVLIAGVRGKCMILPEIGGFYKEDAEYLLEKLWENRVAFLQASGILSWQGTPGWSALLAVIWHYMRQTDNSTLPLKRLRNLILRYAMSAPRPECYLLEDMVVAIEKHLPPPTPGNEELPPVDEYDVEFMGEVFMRYLDVPLALKEVYHNTLTTLPDRAPSLLSAVIERVWGILEETGSKFTPQERILHSFDYALNAITSMSLALRLLDNYSDHDQTIETATVVWTELLRNVNILELVGRLCSIIAISTNNSGSELLICPARLEYFMKSTRRLMAELKDIIQVHALENLNELSHMWHKSNTEPNCADRSGWKLGRRSISSLKSWINIGV
ncbi:Peroxide stress-activated histidine kinase mak2 [Rhizoctonia solani]|uniref:Peroxide stress-activated histidine kinase mak2 n=1 Tax=Rhizoctonia solani TaxID=456999 RepID=A0A0K6FPU2_9AGAM|nr:Peroxide stress-activated histidine kinase mak2 [Rhizoctonia solani]